MKIDIARKLPETPDTIIMYQKENGKLEEFSDWLTENQLKVLKRFMEKDKLIFKANETTAFHYVDSSSQIKFVLLGMGKEDALNAEKIRKAFADAIRQAIKLKSKQIYILPGFDVPLTDALLGQIIAESAILTSYKFEKYFSESKYEAPEAVHLLQENKNNRNLNKGILEGRILAETTLLARDLVNEPANSIYPDSLAEAAKKAALSYGFSIEIFSLEKLRRMKMEAFLSVAKGSKHEPRLIIMRHLGNPDKKHDTIALIGKGLTFDSGGYCLKPAPSMINMKNDMGGAAAVIGIMSAIAALKLKLNVVGIIAACENMISGEAYRPGDIVRSMAGKTIEIGNTDAEGRLTLIDAIHYAIERENAVKLIDLATLTGAAVIAMGTGISPVFGNKQEMIDSLNDAAKISGENIWQMPLPEDYKELLKSEVADLKNTGGQGGGAITAALFLQEFVQNLPWMHIDIAGTAFRDKESGYQSYGGTGFGVRLVTTFLKMME